MVAPDPTAPREVKGGVITSSESPRHGGAVNKKSRQPRVEQKGHPLPQTRQNRAPTTTTLFRHTPEAHAKDCRDPEGGEEIRPPAAVPSGRACTRLGEEGVIADLEEATRLGPVPADPVRDLFVRLLRDSPMKILIVDGEGQVADLFAESVELKGHEAIVGRSGTEGLTL